jgi:hypothetical protein
MSQTPRRHPPKRRMGEATMDIGALIAFLPGPAK